MMTVCFVQREEKGHYGICCKHLAQLAPSQYSKHCGPWESNSTAPQRSSITGTEAEQ